MRACICMVWVGVHAKTCTCTSEENFVEFIPSLHPPLGGLCRSNSGYQTCTTVSFTCWVILCFLLLPFLLFFLNWHAFVTQVFIKSLSNISYIFTMFIFLLSSPPHLLLPVAFLLLSCYVYGSMHLERILGPMNKGKQSICFTVSVLFCLIW